MPRNPLNPRRLMTDEERQRIVALYEQHLSSGDIARQVGRDSGHIRQIVREAGIARERGVAIKLARMQGKGRHRGPNPFTEEQLATARSLYDQGLSSNEIADVVGHSGRMVREYLALEGRTRSLQEGVRLAVRRGKIKTVGRALNLTLFDAWTPESAWVLGLIFGDGHVMNDPAIGQYGIALAGTEEVCRKVAAIVNPQLQPRKAKDANCWILQWYSREMVEGLVKYGLTGGSKARNIRMPEVPQEMLGHFLRGLWDADGCWQRKGRSLSARIQLASEGMIEDLRQILGGRGSSGTTYLRGKQFDNYSLHLRVEETRALIDLLYSASTDALRCSLKHGKVTGR